MADKKVSELDAITGADTAADDLFLIVDSSGSVTKKISRAELNNAIEQDVLSTVDINGGTIDGTAIGGTTPSTGDFTTLTTTGNATIGGDLTINGTTTTVNSTTLDIDDINITVASGAADAAAADGAGLTVDGASATFSYASTGDKWTMNKPLDVTGDIIVSGNVDGRDVAADGTKLDGIEASADVTDATNVQAAGALMDSELTSEASVKALNQGVATTDDPSFVDATFTGTGAVKMPAGTTAQRPTPAQGQIRFNTTDTTFEGYDGSAWGAIGGDTGEVSLILYEYTATSGQTTFSGSDDNAATLSYTADNLQVVMNGIVLDPSDFTATNGTSVVLATGAATGSLVNIYAFKTFTVADTVSASAGGAFAGNVDITARLDVDNIRIDGNTISSTDTNGDITLDPDGTGDTIIASGNVGIGTTSPSDFGGTTLQTNHATTYSANLVSSGAYVLQMLASEAQGAMSIGARSNHHVAFTSNDTERLRIDASGKVGVSNTTPGSYENGAREFVVGTSGDTGITVASGSSDKGSIFFADGTSGGQKYEGQIRYDHSNNRMMFATGGTGHVFIDSSGRLLVGTTSTVIDTAQKLHVVGDQAANFQATVTTGGGTALNIDRSNADGALIRFRQAGTTEGTISVSGSTVSYNGGHLSRWSQATDGNRITGLVKGTVMTNLDQMAVWSHDEVLWTADDELPDGVSVGDVRTAAYTEDNEQLNCMAVSSVEGDANVAGVFVNWDEDDDFNDMNIAMTGDMVIRIASGTTVARGDLLMSAGDGTAKPQGDDIVRSKTIAKVTSTTVSHTYDDGTFLVPCVLMAC